MKCNGILIVFLLSYECYIIAAISTFHNLSPFEYITLDKLFIDKTELIKTFITNAANFSRILITCPDGFGKTVNSDMIRRFFEIARSDERKAENYRLFHNSKLNLDIMRDGDFVNEHYGKYPVVSVTFDMTENATSYTNILQEVQGKICEAFIQYKWLYTNETKTINKEFYQRICDKQASAEDLQICFKILSRNIHNFYQKPIILLIDDYDSPLIAAMLNGIFSKISAIFLSMLEHAFSIDRQYVLLTGISGIPKVENFQFRNVEKIHRYHFLREHPFFQYYGFTLKEMQNFYNRSKFTPKFENELTDIVEPFYNGYQVIENPTASNASVFVKQRIFKSASVSRYFNTRISEFYEEIRYFESPMIEPKEVIRLEEYLKDNLMRKTIENFILKQSIRFRLISHKASDSKALAEMLSGIEKVKINTHLISLYFSLLFDMGYVTYSDEQEVFTIANEEMNLQLLINLNRYLTRNLANADDKSNKVVTKLNIIAECENPEVLEGIAVELEAILNDMYASLCNSNQSSKEDFHSLLYTTAALYNHECEDFEYVKSNVIVDKRLENYTKIIRGDVADIAILSSLSKHVLYIDIRKAEFRTTALTKIESYRPPENELESINLLKFMVISLGRNRKVRIDYGTSTFPFS